MKLAQSLAKVHRRLKRKLHFLKHYDTLGEIRTLYNIKNTFYFLADKGKFEEYIDI